MPTPAARIPEQQQTPEWVRAAQAGDRQAWRALFDQYRGPVFAYCLNACNGDKADALDLTQEVFVRVFRGLPALQNPERFRSWLFTVAANAARNKWAAGSSRRRAMEGFLLEHDVHLDPADSQKRTERDEVVRRALEAIDGEPMRSIALMKYTDPEHTTREIAEKLGIPHGTVTVKLLRFRKRFKGHLVELLGAAHV
jgi:RNA polymerase sigma-70 factor (ECF subfamily)